MATSATAARLEAELNSILYLATGLEGYVSSYDDLLEPDRVATALEILYRPVRHIRNVALAPDNVIRYIYPLAGNRDAMRLDYRLNPLQWPEVRRAMEQRSTVLAGPRNFPGKSAARFVARTKILNCPNPWMPP